MTSRYVAYYRVSTKRQGISGLGLDAQRDAVRRFVAGGELIAEFEEVESGRAWCQEVGDGADDDGLRLAWLGPMDARQTQ